jgi:KaiC/GvpD/RAD55 family RecA-like ATPase
MLTADGALLKAFNASCLAQGIVKGKEKLYVSLAHSDEDVKRALEVFGAALDSLPRKTKARA